MAARGSGGIVGEREVGVAAKRQHEASCGDENVLCLDCITSHIPVVITYCLSHFSRVRLRVTP